MIADILLLACLVVVTEAVTEIVTSSRLTDGVRAWWKQLTYPADRPPPDTYLQNLRIQIDYLLSCGYCSSVWVSGVICLFAPQIIPGTFANWFVSTMLVHRLSNWLHVVYELVRKGRVQTHDILLKQETDNGSDGQDSGT